MISRQVSLNVSHHLSICAGSTEVSHFASTLPHLGFFTNFNLTDGRIIYIDEKIIRFIIDADELAPKCHMELILDGYLSPISQ